MEGGSRVEGYSRLEEYSRVKAAGEGRIGEVMTTNKRENYLMQSTNSFRDLGTEARLRRRGFRKTVEKGKPEEEEVEDEGLCSPYISFLAVKEEDGRDEDSDVEDVWDSSSSRSSSDFSHQRAVSE